MEGEVSNGTTTRALTGLSVLVVLAVGVALLSGTAAADDGIGIERNGSEIAVTAGSPAYNGSANTTTATVRVGSVARNVTLRDDGGGYDATVAISEFSGATVNFGNATVIVTVNGTNDARTLDLRVLKLSEPDPTPGQPLRFGVDQAVGIQSPLFVRVDNGSERVLVRASLQGNALDVPLERVHDRNLSVLGSVTVTTLPGSNWSHDRSVDLRSVSRTWFRSQRSTTSLVHPLVVAGTDYEVTIRTTGPEGTFTATRQASPGAFGGRLDVPGAVVFARSRNVTIQRASDGRVVTKNATGSLLPRETVRVTLDGTIPTDRLVASPTALWVQGTGGAVAKLPASAYNDTTGKLNYTSAPVNVSTELTVLASNGSATSAVRFVNESAAKDSGGTPTTTTTTDTQTGTQNGTSPLPENLSGFVTTFLPAFIGVVLGMILLVAGVNGNQPGFVTGGLLVAGLGLFTSVILFSASSDSTGRAVLTILAALLSTVVVGAIRYVTLKLQDTSGHVSMESLMIPAVIGVSLLVVAAVGAFDVLPAIPVWPVTGGLYGTVLVTSVMVLTEWPPLEGAAAAGGSAGPTVSSRSKSEPTTYDTRIRVVDHAGDPIDDEVPVALERELGGTQRDRIVGGEGTVALKQGTYTITAEYAGQTDVARRVDPSRRNRPVTLQFEGRTVAVTALNRDDGSRVADATVETTTDGGEELRGETDSRGRWERTVDVSVQRVDVSVDHERYESASTTVDPSATDSIEVEMRPLAGTVAVSARLDGRSLPGVDVELRSTTPAVDVSRTGTTGDDGSVTFEDVPIGDYEVTPVDVPPAYTVESVRTTVEDRQTSRPTVTFRFEYDLPTSLRSRVDDLRSAASSITDTNRDAAIQRYYVTVIHRVLDAVERVPGAGYPLLVHGVDPDDLATALLDAAERATETVEEVMSSKRNVDLFTACQDLPDADVTWSGDVTVEAVLEVAERDVSQQRTDIIDRLESIDDRIDDERASLQEVSPAREMRDGIRDLVREQQGTTDLSFAATTVVAEALLDAIDELFEHDPLRTRMERTVY